MKYSDNYWNDIEKVVTNNPKISDLKSSKLLITGATGMVCSAIVDMILFLNKQHDFKVKLYLAGRNKQKAMDRFAGFICGKDYEFIQFDTTKDEPISIDPDYIIHGASNANPAMYAEEPVETALGNVIGTNVLLRLSAEKKVKKFLFISSSEIYGNKSGNLPFAESDYGFIDALNPRAAYPNAKRLAETLCASYKQEHGVDSVIVRPGHIYGPTITNSDNRASADFIRNVLAGNDIIMKSAGAQLRSYCYVLDCASAIVYCLLFGRSGEAYNISNCNSIVSIRDIAETLAKIGGVKTVFENPSDEEKKSYNLMSNSSLNSNKLEGLDWKSCFDLKDGVKATLDVLR